MHILNLFEAVYKSHVLSLVKKGLECRKPGGRRPGGDDASPRQSVQ